MSDKYFVLVALGCVVTLSGCGGGGGGPGMKGGVSTFQGSWSGSEEYVQGTFADPLAIENLGPTSLTIDSSGNIMGQTTDALTKTVFTLTGMVQEDTPTTGTGSITGLPGPFNTATSPNLNIGGNFKLTATFMSLTIALGNSFGECTMTFGVPGPTQPNQYAGKFTGTITATGVSGTVSSLVVDADGNLTGSALVGGAMASFTGTIATDGSVSVTSTPGGTLTGAAALTGDNGGMTLYLSGSSTTETVNLVPAS